MFTNLETLANLHLRSLLASVRGQFFFVRFVKRDGTIREMKCQLGNDAAYIVHTPQGDKASQTFAANNPDMLRVRDVDVLRELPEDQKHLSWRTIDCVVIMDVRIAGQRYDVRTYEHANANASARLKAGPKAKPSRKKVA